MNVSFEDLGNLLIEKNILDDNQLFEALDIHNSTGEKFENIILDKKWLSEEELYSAFSELLNIPYVKLESSLVDRSIIDTIPLSMARKYKVLPIVKMGDELAVAMADPLDVYAIDAIQYYTNCKLHVSLTTPNDIDHAIDKYYSLKDSMNQVVQNINEIEANSLDALNEESDININDETDESSVIRLVNLVILQAIKDRASDIHFEPDETVFRIRYRIDGALHEAFMPPKNLQSMIISRLKIMGDMDVSERRIPQDGRFSLKIDKKEIDIRASILPTVKGEKAVLRILDKSNSLVKLKDAGFSDEIYKTWVSVIKKTEGILLITGPTGSGKSTTLYSTLNHINSKDSNIVTVENPVEYKFPYMNQVQVNSKAGLTFAIGLRAILRQDPDIIMLGEIRDKETAEIAIRSALTGHLVLSTLHTNDAPGAIARLIDMGLEPFLVESSLIAILAQRLVRTICPRCKAEVKFDDFSLYELQIPEWVKFDKFYKGKGCVDCKNSGFMKRTAIHELLVVDSDIRKLIISGASTDDIRRAAIEKGMRTLKEDGFLKASQGVTTIEEVLRVSSA